MEIGRLLSRFTKAEHLQGEDLEMNAGTLDQMNAQIVSLFEKQFGRYGLNLLLRYWGWKPIRHAVEEYRLRTLPFDIIADVRHNIDFSKRALTQDNKKITFIALFVRLYELFHDHLIEQGEPKYIFYDLSGFYTVVTGCLQDYQQRLHLPLEIEGSHETASLA